MLINIRTNEVSTDPTSMKISDKISIQNIIDNATKNLNRSTSKGYEAYEILKTHIYVDYQEINVVETEVTDPITEEVTIVETKELVGDVITDFHPNIYLLYTEEEREVIKNFILIIEAFISEYEYIKKEIPSLLKPIERLEELEG